MANYGIHGQLLEVTVVGCNKLKDTEWISRQDPYVCIEYGSTKFRTRTCTDGGKNPTFQEKFVFTLIEGLREINVLVWNSNTLTFDDFIGSGKAQLQKVLSQGFDDSPWPLQTKSGRHAGEVRLILHYSNANKPAGNHHPSTLSAPQSYGAPQLPQVGLYSTPPPPQPAPHYPPPPPATHYPLAPTSHHYPPPSSGYPSASPYPSYPSSVHGPPPPSGAYPPAYPPSSAYPPQPYPPPPQPYPPPPQPYPPPPQQYPPPPQQYPPPPHYAPPGAYGVYPPRPY